jgi:transposase
MSQGVKTLLNPGVSPDFSPVENLFARMEQMLENRPTRTLEQLRMVGEQRVEESF